jgi:hypothetical protein
MEKELNKEFLHLFPVKNSNGNISSSGNGN